LEKERKKERRIDIGQEDPAETNASDESAGVEHMPTLPHSTKQHGRGETKEKGGRGGEAKTHKPKPQLVPSRSQFSTENLRVENVAES
jgi:hypothetical protein